MTVRLRGFCALALCAGGIVLFAQAQRGPGFPVYPPTPDADPAIVRPVEVSLPSRLSVQRTPGSLSVAYDLASMRNVKIMVGKKMTIGMKDEFRAYPEGDTRPVSYRTLSQGDVRELSNPSFLNSAEALTSAHDGIPASGKRYVVEHDIVLFETDLPAQHFWSPQSGKLYRVLWEEKVSAVR